MDVHIARAVAKAWILNAAWAGDLLSRVRDAHVPRSIPMQLVLWILLLPGLGMVMF